MKNLILLLILSILCCCSSKKNIGSTSSNQESIAISINGLAVKNGKSKLKIKRQAFSLEFNVFPANPDTKEWHAAQIAATADPADLVYFKEGELSVNNPYYSPTGSGFAGYRDKPYEYMWIEGSGHHYIHYLNMEEKRATWIESYDNGKVRLRWDVENFSIDDEKISIEDSTLEVLYLMVFIDNNLNEIIEEDEYSLITLKFE